MENKTDESKIICLICQTADTVFFVAKNSYNIYRCRRCGLLFVRPKPENWTDVYSKDYFIGKGDRHGYVDYEVDKSAMSATLDAYLDKMEEILPDKGRLLDVGAATGVFLQVAKRRGWGVKGIEPVDWAAQKAREKGLEVATGRLSDLSSEPNDFDAVTYLDVLEHLPEPDVELSLVREILKPNGLLIINTPDAGSWLARILGKWWHLLTPPEHLIIFNRKNLTRLLQKRGFEVLKIDKISKRFTLQYIFKILANWQKTMIWRRLGKFLENGRLGKINISINLRDNFFVIARKKI